MKLPARELRLSDGLSLPSREISSERWQYHVLKHPLGCTREASIHPKNTPDPERWGELDPPVIEPGWRDAAFQSIAGLEVHEQRCALPEVHGRRPKPEKGGTARFACWDCPLGLARACEQATTAPHPIGPRYAAAAEGLLASLVDGERVPRERVTELAMSQARFPAIIATLAVLYVGEAGNGSGNVVARAIRGDGLVVEFNLHQDGWDWKTTHRRPALGGGQAATLFMNPPPRLTQTRVDPWLAALSDRCLVARQWWEKHGN
jgi:hypothetical protein